MTISASSAMTGLALLTGDSSLFTTGAVTVETRAVRLARAQFTLPTVTPPWKEATSRTPPPVAVGAVKRMASIIDEVRGRSTLPPDVQTSFTAYKALDRLRMLAEWAARSSTSAAERTELHNSFARGVTELQKYLAVAPSDKLTLAFATPARKAESLVLPASASTAVPGSAVSATRDAPLAGLTGMESFTLALSRPGSSDTLQLDLSATPQPPTLDSVANAFNAAIAAIPMRDAGGNVVLDAAGQPRPRWDTSFKVVKTGGKWGLELATMGVEQLTLRQIGAGDALMVAAGQSVSLQPNGTALMRFDLPVSDLQRLALGSLSAIDDQGTAEARLINGKAAAPVASAIAGRAMATDAHGFTYLVGTTGGSVGTQVGDGADDLQLTKLDARGTVIWQRGLGTAGSAEGAAISITADGEVVVAGTAQGDTDGAASDGDLLVARFSAAGEERFATLVRAVGSDRASAVAVGADGYIMVGGRDAGGNGVLARLDAGGRLLERRTLAASHVRSLAAGPDGSLFALTGSAEGAATLHRLAEGGLAESATSDLGSWDAHTIAIAEDGRIAVGGTVAAGGSRDARVAIVDPDFTTVRTAVLASSEDDRLDSLAWLNGELFATGRTSGALGNPRAGEVDGFLARIDADTGTVEAITQWGRSGTRVEPVQLAAAPAANSATLALGFRNGILNPADSDKLVDQTSLRPGDRFTFRVDGGRAQEISIGKSDTLASLADRMSRMAGRNVAVTTARSGDRVQLRIEAKPGHALELIAGPSGGDALAKLGLAPTKLVAPPPFSAKAPRVVPGGHYGLELGPGLSIRNEQAAKVALGKLSAAIGTTQSAFRSLYWDSNKEALVNGSNTGSALSKYQSSQLGRYQDALTRLMGA